MGEAPRAPETQQVSPRKVGGCGIIKSTCRHCQMFCKHFLSHSQGWLGSGRSGDYINLLSSKGGSTWMATRDSGHTALGVDTADICVTEVPILCMGQENKVVVVLGSPAGSGHGLIGMPNPRLACHHPSITEGSPGSFQVLLSESCQ
jgi:hypothetical protein